MSKWKRILIISLVVVTLLFIYRSYKKDQKERYLSAPKKKKATREEVISWFSTGNLDQLQTHDCDDVLDSNLYCVAAAKGHLNCIKWLYEEKGFSFSGKQACLSAAENGHLDCLQYLHTHGCPWINHWPCTRAAANGHLACLKYAHENGCQMDSKETCANAAFGGNIECLKYAHRTTGWDQKTLLFAAIRNNIECLKYAYENGCPITSGARDDSYNILVSAAIGSNSPVCMKYAREVMGCIWKASVCEAAARKGNLACLQYAVQNGCEVGKAIYEAANGGHMNCFYYLYSCSIARLFPTFSTRNMIDVADRTEPRTTTDIWSEPFTYPDEFVSKFDLEDPMWRDVLFTHDLANHPLLKAQVIRKKFQIGQMKQACLNVLGKIVLPKDVIQYIICEYL